MHAFWFVYYLLYLSYFLILLENKCIIASLLTYFVFGGLQIEMRNNKLEMQSVNNKSLIEELDKLLERLRIPSEVLLWNVSFALEFEVYYVYYSFSWLKYVHVRGLIFNLLSFLPNAVCGMPYRWLIWWGSHASEHWSLWVASKCFKKPWRSPFGSYLCKHEICM